MYPIIWKSFLFLWPGSGPYRIRRLCVWFVVRVQLNDVDSAFGENLVIGHHKYWVSHKSLLGFLIKNYRKYL